MFSRIQFLRISNPAMRSMASVFKTPAASLMIQRSFMLTSQQQTLFGFATARKATTTATKTTKAKAAQKKPPAKKQTTTKQTAAKAPAKRASSKVQRILVTGCSGQIGKSLAPMLCQKYGTKNILLTDLITPKTKLEADFKKLNVANQKNFFKLAEEFKPTIIIHLAALLSASAQQNPEKAFDINTKGFHNALQVARKMNAMIYSPSSMAVYGRCSPKNKVAVQTSLRPNTIYGITKVENQLMGLYYREKFDVDYRAIRYVGIMSAEEQAFHGTTDYSSDMIWKAANGDLKYEACLEKERKLSMMYIDDALEATMKLIEAPKKNIISAVYNLNGVSASPQDFAKALQKSYKSLKVTYKPSFRDQIAKTWPASFNDSSTKEFGWQYKGTVTSLVKQMLNKINEADAIEDAPVKPAARGRKPKAQTQQVKKTTARSTTPAKKQTTKKATATTEPKPRGRPKAVKEQTKKAPAKSATPAKKQTTKKATATTEPKPRGRPKAVKEQTKKAPAKSATPAKKATTTVKRTVKRANA